MTGRLRTHHASDGDYSARARVVQVGKRSLTVELLEPFY
jgi:hypothetical protein